MPEIDPERWRAVSQRLDEVLDLREEERAPWLAALREQDPTLADAVRDLLEEHEIVRRKHFLEEAFVFGPGAGIAAPPISTTGQAGSVFGAYRLVSAIGHGGMGVVWLAERCDGRFEHRVAVKLLDMVRFTRSEVRFHREASILARVTHPNIAHLIDAGVSPDGQPYLVLELVDGQPIDRHCDDRALGVAARIGLFLDVLDAVSHAHSHRIVHRDIKPSNVLVRTDGHVKLLDFGIAKLLERDGQPGTASTVTLEHGTALTPAYAAPEQMSGGRVTTATDVYALGVLLYVLLTGRHPYAEANSPAGLLKAIVEIDTPPPSTAVLTGHGPGDLAAIAASRATTPDGLHQVLKGDLDTIVAKALKKDPPERYASVADLADDLRRYLAAEPIRARGDSLARRTARLVGRHKRLTAGAALGVVALSVLAGLYAMRPGAARDRTPDPAAHGPTPLTSEVGDEQSPSLSPDRTRLAFSWVPRNASGGRIAVKTLGSDAVVQLTDGVAGNDSAPVWSPDGRHLAFLRTIREPAHRLDVCLVPAGGGPSRVLHSRAGRSLPGLAWWTARNALLFPTRGTPAESFHLAALDLATLEVRQLTHPPPAPALAGPGDSFPAVAPDERTVAFVRETYDGRDVFLLDLATGVARRLTRDGHRILGLTWSPDGQAVIMSSVRSGVAALYRVSLTDGRMTRLLNTAEGAADPMATPDGLIYSQTQTDSNIYRLDLRDGRPIGAPRPIVTSSRSDEAPHVSPDARSIAFLSRRAGGPDIWVAEADGSSPRRLTSLPMTSGPRWSPDGRWIAFGALSPGLARPDVWVVDAGGGPPRRLTDDPSYETVLDWAADSASLYFLSDRTGSFDVWSVPVGGGTATRVTQGGLRAQESRDGRFLYYANDVPEVWRRPLREAGAAELITTFPEGTHWGGDWVAGAHGLYYLNEDGPGPAAVDFLPFGSVSRASAIRLATLTAPPTHQVTVFAVAPDESWLAWAQDDYRNSDIMMLPWQ